MNVPMLADFNDFDFELQCPCCKGKQSRSVGWIRGSETISCRCGHRIDAKAITAQIAHILESCAGGLVNPTIAWRSSSDAAPGAHHSKARTRSRELI
jgi:hypothetical protein